MNLTVYTAPWCRDCHTAKRWLAEHRIAYKEINIEEVPGAAEEVIQRTGKRAIPQFVLDGKWIQPYVPGADLNTGKWLSCSASGKAGLKL